MTRSEIAKGLAHRARAHLPFAPLVLGTALLARSSIKTVLEKVGHPAAALDDSYIHFQYARAIVEGHPFRFQAGEPISTGATSFLWPALLAIPYALGLRGDRILWGAWLFSFVALGALAYETYLLSRPLAGRGAAAGAAAMVLAFGGFAWGAASGMEVVPFAWVLTASTRRASDWVEQPERRSRRELGILACLAFAAPLVRPEGAIASLMLGAAVALCPREATPKGRAEVLVFALAAIFPNLLLLLLTGHATASTTQVKLLIGNPYLPMPDTALANARTLVTSILDGELWSAEFLPKGGATIACAGLAATGWRGWAERRGFRAMMVVALALAMFVPCLYVTFLWNRLRYLWPFAPGWFVGLACLARSLGWLVGRVDSRAGATAATLTAGAFAGMLAVRLDWVIEDVGQSASGITRQQASLGRWADANLPPTARIGLNDTGAIAYFGNRKTFDIVGLTTPTEGRYWIAGAGARFEHYERLRRSAPASMPTHFIVYPEWMACDPVLGARLHEAVVTDSTILGGQIMRVYEARWDHLGSGDKPWSELATMHDELDVADLESEGAHGYELLGARDPDCIAEEGNAPGGAIVADGGRRRVRDRFVARLPAGRASIAIVRVQADKEITLELVAGGRKVGSETVQPGPWTEVKIPIPADVARAETPIDVSAAGATFTSFHYWFGE